MNGPRALLARHPGRLVIVLALTLGAGMVEGVGLLLLIPLLAIVGIDVPVDGAMGAVAERVEVVLSFLGLPVSLPVVLAVYVVVIGLQSGLRYLEEVRSTTLVEDLKADLREELFGALTRADWLYHLRTRTSDLLHVLNDEVYRVGDVATQAISVLTMGVTALVYLAVALYLSPLASGVALVTAAGLLVLLRARSSRSRAAGEAWSDAAEGVYFTASEFLTGLKTAKSHAAEARHTRAFGRETRKLAASWVGSARSYADVRFFFTTGAVVVLSLLVWAALEVFRLDAAALLVLIFIFLRLIPRFSALQNGLQYMATALPALERVEGVLREAGAAAETGVGQAPSPGPAGRPAPLTQGIRFEAVSFAYPAGLSPHASAGDPDPDHAAGGERGRPTPVLHEVSLEVPAQRTTALVGVSGGGKTTLADLLIGLLDPDRGRVLIDGTPLAELDRAAWRSRIGYVAQESFLFNDTIRANLAPDPGGNGAPGLDEAELSEALQTARMDEFVAGLPRGLDTVVGERGVRLSGGERQRLALARALVRHPALLILDEATSALDYENEALIRQALGRLHGEMTVLMITHRLRMAREADRIHVLESGRVVQSGTWDDLLATEGRFRELALAAGLVG